MATPILIFFHGLFCLGNDLLPQAIDIISEQMSMLNQSGLEDAASEIHIGLNGGDETAAFAELFPARSIIVFHGLQCRTENRTIAIIEERVKRQNSEAYCLYFHSKGASFPRGDDYRTRWRNRMMHHLITNWKTAVAELDGGCEAVGCNYLRPEDYPGLVGCPYFAGTFWFARASFLKTIPPITQSPAVKQHGLDAFESRYEAESWIGQGPRRPRIKDFSPGWP